jgi:hypothetical protein
MPDEPILREKAARPSGARHCRHGRTAQSGGPGSGDVCGEPVARHQIDLEMEFARQGVTPDTPHLHLRCFAAWEFERTEVEGAPN